MRASNRKSLDILAYIGIAIAIVGYAVVTTIYTSSYTDETHAIRSWIGFGLMTLLLSGWLISNHRAYLKSIRFWLSFSGLVAVHIVVGAMLIGRFQSIPYPFFAIALLLEGQLLSALLGRVLKQDQGLRC